jgi:metal-dependent amidase/aminoacylase/carboxypeptidase family protein
MAEALAGRAPKEPTVQRVYGTDALVNDAALAARVSTALQRALGADRVTEAQPEMGSEDFSKFAQAGVPTLMLRIGVSEPAAVAAALKGGAPLVSLHSPFFKPDLQPALKAAIAAEVTSLRELMPPASR